jgi:tetratricopeptide (TPR) repeat protein
MTSNINRDTIIEFLFGTLSKKRMSVVAAAIVSNSNLKKIYTEVRNKVITHYYSDNELLPYERIDFEYKLDKNEHLLKEVKLHKNLNLEETHDNNFIYNSFQKKKSISEKHTQNKKFKHWLVVSTITVLLILGGGTSYFFQTQEITENELFASFYSPLDYTDSYLLTSNSFNIAKQKYIDGDYSNALVLLQGLPTKINIEVERNFFIGLSLMEIGKFNAAIEYFEQIISHKNGFEYIPHIRWYSGLCYLKTGSKEKAIDTFSTIVYNQDYNSKKAKKILKKLNVKLFRF